METVRAPIQQMMNTIQLVLGGIGAVSLVVAALGIPEHDDYVNL